MAVHHFLEPGLRPAVGQAGGGGLSLPRSNVITANSLALRAIDGPAASIQAPGRVLPAEGERLQSVFLQVIEEELLVLPRFPQAQDGPPGAGAVKVRRGPLFKIQPVPKGAGIEVRLRQIPRLRPILLLLAQHQQQLLPLQNGGGLIDKAGALRQGQGLARRAVRLHPHQPARPPGFVLIVQKLRRDRGLQHIEVAAARQQPRVPHHRGKEGGAVLLPGVRLAGEISALHGLAVVAEQAARAVPVGEQGVKAAGPGRGIQVFRPTGSGCAAAGGQQNAKQEQAAFFAQRLHGSLFPSSLFGQNAVIP